MGLKCILTGVRPFAPEQLKGAQAVKHGRAGMITLLAAAALTAYALAGLASVGAEIDRYGETRSALAERVRELEEANCELEARLNRGRADKNELIEALARERLGLRYPDETG